MNTSTSLITKYRPQTFADIVGQPQVVKSLQGVIAKKSSQTFLFTGNPGTGKTTLARIAAREFGAEDSQIQEIDAATNTGIDDMRKIIESLGYRPLGGKLRPIIIDECHALSSQAWDALLKSLEEPRPWNYWFLCTTLPTKVKTSIKTRCTTYALRDLTRTEIYDFLEGIADKENILPGKKGGDIIDLCAKEAHGSPRQGLTNLALCAECDDVRDAAELLRSAEATPEAFDLARLLGDKGRSWGKAMALIADMKDMDPEGVRHVVRSYHTKVALGASDISKCGRSLDILNAFSTPMNRSDGMTPIVLAVAAAFAP